MNRPGWNMQNGRESADHTIQNLAEICATTGGTFSLINGGDVCGQGVKTLCQVQTHSNPIP